MTLSPSSVAVGVPFAHEVITAVPANTVQFLDVVPQRFESSYLHQLQQRFPLLVHDAVGNLLDRPAADDLRKLRELREELQPVFMSETLQARRTEDGRTDVAFPFPPLYTPELLQRVVENIDAIQNDLGGKLVVENPPRFFRIEYPEMTPAEFFTQLVTRTGCGLGLDLSALVLECEQDGREVRVSTREFPLDRVVLIRITGIQDNSELRAHWIAPITIMNPNMLALLRFVADLAPNLRAVVLGSPVTGFDVRGLTAAVAGVRKALA